MLVMQKLGRMRNSRKPGKTEFLAEIKEVGIFGYPYGRN
jgi:hypothetical protein